MKLASETGVRFANDSTTHSRSTANHRRQVSGGSHLVFQHQSRVPYVEVPFSHEANQHRTRSFVDG